jgi:hypothetical protein
MCRRLSVLLVTILFFVSMRGNSEFPKIVQLPRRKSMDLKMLVKCCHDSEKNFNSVDNRTRADCLEWLYCQSLPALDHTKCLLSPLKDLTREYAYNLDTQFRLSAYVYYLENNLQPPHSLREWTPIYAAGYSGVLMAYESLLGKSRQGRVPYLDDLKERKARGRMNSFLFQKLRECENPWKAGT